MAKNQSSEWGIFDNPELDTAVYMLPLAEKLRFVRNHRNESHNNLGALVRDILPAGLPSSRELINRIEHGHVTEDKVSPVFAAALAKALQIPVAFLVPTRTDDVAAIAELCARQ